MFLKTPKSKKIKISAMKEETCPAVIKLKSVQSHISYSLDYTEHDCVIVYCPHSVVNMHFESEEGVNRKL